MHDWRQHYKVFSFCFLKWRKVLRIWVIFYMTGQKIIYKKVLPRHWTRSRSRKKQNKTVSFSKWSRKKFLSGHKAQNWSWLAENHWFISNLTKPITKMFLRLFYLRNSPFPSLEVTVDTLIEVRNQTSKHHFLKSVVSYFVCVPTENIIRTLDSTWIRSVQQVHVHAPFFFAFE